MGADDQDVEVGGLDARPGQSLLIRGDARLATQSECGNGGVNCVPWSVPQGADRRRSPAP
jgi:hypothetical protein